MEVTNVDVNVRPPKPFVIGGENDLAAAWKLWLQQFTWYEVATNLSKKPPEVQVAVFMSAIGPDAAVIYNTFNLTLVEEKSLDTIKARFTRYFTPKANETYERYVFNQIWYRYWRFKQLLFLVLCYIILPIDTNEQTFGENLENNLQEYHEDIIDISPPTLNNMRNKLVQEYFLPLLNN
ncbi:hypothetical protein ACJJTC_011657 [Scirpophaga incertulas]